MRFLCKTAPGKSWSVGLQQIWPARHTKAVSFCLNRGVAVDLSPVSDPVCSVNLYHVLPQSAAEVLYMAKSIN